MNTYGRFDVTFEKGLGAKVWDTEGKEYLDFVSGVAVNVLGHSHPAMINALKEQSQKLIHISNLYWTPTQMELAKKLSKYSDHEQVFFCNSGTEANEVALKLARKYGKVHGGENKTEIIYMENCFHGRTMGALSVTANEKYQKDYTPLIPDTKCIPFNNIEALKNAVTERTCALILEPIQGEGGVLKAEEAFLKEARSLCDQYDALLIFDEVQCGMGRLGSLFAYQQFGVIPDVITMAKGLGGGFPIGATLATKKAASVFQPGDHGCTFGGNPLACSVSLVVLEALMEKGVLENVNNMHKYLVDGLLKLQNKYSTISGIQGMGLLIGLKVEGEPKKIIQKSFEKGLLLIGAGNNVIRILPPLNVEKEDIDAMLNILENVFKEVEKGQ